MEDDGKPDIKDVILKQYELTDAYHDRKTHSAWIASTVYFAFSVGFFSYAPELLENSSTTLKIMATIICSSIFTGAMSFISLQFKSRWDSVIRTSMYNWLFEYKYRYREGIYNVSKNLLFAYRIRFALLLSKQKSI